MTTETAPPSDFEKRFRELQDQWDMLQRQLKEINRAPE